MKYDAQLSIKLNNLDERNGYKNEGIKMNSNAYDGDVEQSEERNRYILMQEIRRKRG